MMACQVGRWFSSLLIDLIDCIYVVHPWTLFSRGEMNERKHTQHPQLEQDQPTPSPLHEPSAPSSTPQAALISYSKSVYCYNLARCDGPRYRLSSCRLRESSSGREKGNFSLGSRGYGIPDHLDLFPEICLLFYNTYNASQTLSSLLFYTLFWRGGLEAGWVWGRYCRALCL